MILSKRRTWNASKFKIAARDWINDDDCVSTCDQIEKRLAPRGVDERVGNPTLVIVDVEEGSQHAYSRATKMSYN